MNVVSNILSEIKPYVYVVGSYARGKETAESDIDLYIKRRSEKELEENGYYDGEGEEHYIDKIIEVFDKYNIQWDSVAIGHISTKTLPIMIEASYHYHVDDIIPKVNEHGYEEFVKNDKLHVFPITILGVRMSATLDTYDKDNNK